MPDLINISKAKAYDFENFMLYGHPALQGILPSELAKVKKYFKHVDPETNFFKIKKIYFRKMVISTKSADRGLKTSSYCIKSTTSDYFEVSLNYLI